MSQREQILASKPHAPERMDVPEWGTKPIYLRVLSARDITTWGDSKDGAGDSIGRLLVMAVVDEQGARIFADGDEKAVMDLPAPGVLRVFTKAGKLNGLSTESLEDAMAAFEPTQGGEGSSA